MGLRDSSGYRPFRFVWPIATNSPRNRIGDRGRVIWREGEYGLNGLDQNRGVICSLEALYDRFESFNIEASWLGTSPRFCIVITR